MTFDANLYVAAWYALLTLLFSGIAVFSIMQFRLFYDKGAQYIAIMFGSIALGTFCVAMVRAHGTAGISQEWWFNFQRASYVGVLLGGWWLVDYRLELLSGEGIQLRTLWRFWNLFRRQESTDEV